MQYLTYPVKVIKVTQKFSTKHYAIDLAWTASKTMPEYSPCDGTVEAVGYSTGAGKYVQIKFDVGTKTWHIRLQHCSKILVSKGSKVTRGQVIAKCGSTGSATGPHCHYEVAVTPKGKSYTNSTANRKKYAVNPAECTYVADWQSLKAGQSDSGLLYCRGTDYHVARNKKKEQVKVVGNLNCRAGAGTNKKILGVMDYGLYDVFEKKTVGKYVWYKVADDKDYWVADTGSRLTHYDAED